eukprot:scaffold25225_cov54-Attheya_sp.AAC.2
MKSVDDVGVQITLQVVGKGFFEVLAAWACFVLAGCPFFAQDWEFLMMGWSFMYSISWLAGYWKNVSSFTDVHSHTSFARSSASMLRDASQGGYVFGGQRIWDDSVGVMGTVSSGCGVSFACHFDVGAMLTHYIGTQHGLRGSNEKCRSLWFCPPLFPCRLGIRFLLVGPLNVLDDLSSVDLPH